ncbi:MAG: SPFH domain-containing protein [Thermoleophilia bacterium]|nr:SPFH domain-containing protein [Thermoleophilia bacterium]
MDGHQVSLNHEKEIKAISGWGMLVAVIVIFIAGIALLIGAAVLGDDRGANDATVVALVVVGIVLLALGSVLSPGFFTLEPNETRVCVLFGAYKGTVRQTGFRWANPFFSNGPTVKTGGDAGPRETAAAMAAAAAGAKKGQPARMPKKYPRYKISVRARTYNGPKLKVNDRRGNPVEIATVVIWRVKDTAQAVFDVDDFEQYVETQSETALRYLASSYAYDHGEENEITLRSNVDEVSGALKTELEQRLTRAGVVVEEARLTHLAYAPEIAQAMLRRQQAEAVIAARQKIVHGAVSMVDMALRDLAEKGVVELDAERKAAMVSNLMVVLCGESEVHPVVNTGTLYA